MNIRKTGRSARTTARLFQRGRKTRNLPPEIQGLIAELRSQHPQLAGVSDEQAFRDCVLTLRELARKLWTSTDIQEGRPTPNGNRGSVDRPRTLSRVVRFSATAGRSRDAAPHASRSRLDYPNIRISSAPGRMNGFQLGHRLHVPASTREKSCVPFSPPWTRNDSSSSS